MKEISLLTANSGYNHKMRHSVMSVFHFLFWALVLILLPELGFCENNIDPCLAKTDAAKALDSELDPSFGSGNGFIITDLGGADQALDVVIDTQCRILVLALKKNTQTSPLDIQIALLRYNADGSLDTSFAHTGLVLFQIGSNTSLNQAVALKIDAQNNIVVLGNIGDEGFLTRFDESGNRDANFGDNGIALISHGDQDVVQDLVIDQRGRLVVSGKTTTDSQDAFFVARFNPDGLLDQSFAKQGFQSFDFGELDTGDQVTVLPNGDIFAVGSIWQERSGFQVTILQLDTYGDIKNQQITSLSGIPSRIAVDAAGQIFITTDSQVVRILPQANSSPSFGKNGSIKTSYPAALLFDEAGNLIVVGTNRGFDHILNASYNFAFTLFDPNGHLADSQSTNLFEIANTQTGSDDWAKSAALDQSGRIVAVGYSGDNIAILRYQTETEEKQAMSPE